VQAERQSQTAFGVAFARAVEHTEPEGRRILDDPYAVEFVRDAAGWAFATRAAFAFARHAIGAVMAGMIEFVAIRGRYSDDVVKAEARAGAEQYVILGAGFDTAALRLRAAQARLAHAVLRRELDSGVNGVVFDRQAVVPLEAFHRVAHDEP